MYCRYVKYKDRVYLCYAEQGNKLKLTNPQLSGSLKNIKVDHKNVTVLDYAPATVLDYNLRRYIVTKKDTIFNNKGQLMKWTDDHKEYHEILEIRDALRG